MAVLTLGDCHLVGRVDCLKERLRGVMKGEHNHQHQQDHMHQQQKREGLGQVVQPDRDIAMQAQEPQTCETSSAILPTASELGGCLFISFRRREDSRGEEGQLHRGQRSASEAHHHGMMDGAMDESYVLSVQEAKVGVSLQLSYSVT